MSVSAIQNRQNPRKGRIKVVTFRSVSELDQQREVARGALLHFVQLASGVIRGRLTHIDLGSSSVHLNSFSLAVRARGLASDTRWYFLAFPRQVAGVFSGETLAPDKVLVYRPGGEFEGTSFGPFQDWVFTVEDAQLRSAVDRRFGVDLPEFSGSCGVFRPELRYLRALRQFGCDMVSLAFRFPGALADVLFRQWLHEELTEKLADVLISAQASARLASRSLRSHARLVRLSEDFLAAHPNRQITLAELVAATDASERTLRNAFHSVVGLSPHAYLKIRRLHQARMWLERSNPRTATVTEVALALGFVHLGNFARDYRRLFGEYPSETLAREE